ncbi:MAG TPA: FAD-dependent oxidoreductase, partial [Solirubrobacterales bacterium]|nr:FAD-dependent oxidoreductase [Solirubrobacterales bacterium]
MTGASPGLVDEASVLIVGGGPAGLAAATELRRRGVEGVVVLERERDAGGIPRHASHQGFGIRDLHIPMSGPRYARRCATTARAAGAEILTETMVTRWSPNGPMEITGPRGRWSVNPNAVLLATGCRERPRSARFVPGTRPQGVMTTATLQQLVYLERRRLNGGGLIVGAEHVSFSAVATLAHGGARPIGLVTELPRHQSLGPFRAGARIRHGARLWSRTRVTAIAGEHSGEEVERTELESGEA